MEAGRPMTRVSLEQLPARESLVRPSSIESLPHHITLLSAAHEAADTPAEELLRPL